MQIFQVISRNPRKTNMRTMIKRTHLHPFAVISTLLLLRVTTECYDLSRAKKVTKIERLFLVVF